MIFSSREDAGRRLGESLVEQGVQPDVVLGLPRGGVVVAAEVARILQRPLDVLVVRKIGHPRHREYAVGALAEDGVVLLDREAMAETQVEPAELEEVIAEEIERARDYQTKFHPGQRLSLAGKSVLIVDDGLATGATAEAAVMSAKKQTALSVTVAAPVGSPSAIARLKRAADEVIVLETDPGFISVGHYYEKFPQTDDEEVSALLCARY